MEKKMEVRFKSNTYDMNLCTIFFSGISVKILDL